MKTGAVVGREVHHVGEKKRKKERCYITNLPQKVRMGYEVTITRPIIALATSTMMSRGQ